MARQKITTFLWFNDNAEEAANFYVSIFKNSKITNTTRYSEMGPGPAGSVMTIEFELDGVPFIALNGGPHFQFTEAISLSVDCETQQEIDHYWSHLTQGGRESHCGWLKDKYGLSWQIVPSVMGQLMSDPATSKAVMETLLQMSKLDIQKLKDAANKPR